MDTEQKKWDRALIKQMDRSNATPNSIAAGCKII
jgi:hypothetical protein